MNNTKYRGIIQALCAVGCAIAILFISYSCLRDIHNSDNRTKELELLYSSACAPDIFVKVESTYSGSHNILTCISENGIKRSVLVKNNVK